MKVVYGISKIERPLKRAVVTVGIFDGVHIGHQFILKKTIARAKRIGGTSVVVTFNPHPLKVLRPQASPALLTSLNHRIGLIACLGADVCLVMNFTKRFCCLSPGNFIKNILVKKLRTREIFVGDNFHFGYGEKGSIKLLQDMSEKFAFKVNCVNPVRNYDIASSKEDISNGVNILKNRGSVISSTQIRLLIERGKIKQAAHLLDRPVSILGTVIKGSARGRWMGYPTANIDPHQEAIPPRGVYAVRIKLGKRNLSGLLNIGTRPTFSLPANRPSIEVHIFDFKEDIYGRDLEISFVKKLRCERRFLTKEQLAKQIERDCRQAKKPF